MSTSGGPPAGWYAHPDMADTQRYWDGDAWTDHFAPGLPQRVAQISESAEAKRSADKLTTVGVVLAILLPIGGFIVGCMLLGRGRTVAGAWIMLGSVAAGIVFASIWASIQHQNCVTDNLTSQTYSTC